MISSPNARGFRASRSPSEGGLRVKTQSGPGPRGQGYYGAQWRVGEHQHRATGSTTGSLNLYQHAYGGSGGGASGNGFTGGTAGAGGSASSTQSVTDGSASSLTVYSWAQGGGGGGATDSGGTAGAGGGADATANATSTAATSTTGEAYASGGAGGSNSSGNSGSGGNATATANVTGNGSGYGQANANASGGSSPTSPGSATARASVSNTTTGTAYAQSAANNGLGWNTTAYAQTPVGSATTGATASTMASFGTGQVALSTLAAGHAATIVRLTPTDVTYATAAMSAGGHPLATEPFTYYDTAYIDFTTTSAETLYLDLINYNVSGNGFASLAFTVDASNGFAKTYDFTTLASAESFFNKDTLDLGAIVAGSQAVDVYYYLTAAAGSDFDGHQLQPCRHADLPGNRHHTGAVHLGDDASGFRRPRLRRLSKGGEGSRGGGVRLRP